MGYSLARRHISVQFDDELEQIRSQLLSLGGLVEQQLHDASMALKNKDFVCAEKALIFSSKVESHRTQIEEACERFIMKRQPAGQDLRLIVSIIKMTGEMVVSAHLIKKMVMPLLDNVHIIEWLPLENLAYSTSLMLHQVLDAVARMDLNDAKQWYEYDDHLDKLKHQIQVPIIAQMKKNPEKIQTFLVQLRWARLLENIGDTSQNICFHVLTYAQHPST